MFKTSAQRAAFARDAETLLERHGSNAFGLPHANKALRAMHEDAVLIFTDGRKHLDGSFTRQSFYDILELAAKGHTRPLREQLQAILDARPANVAEDAAITAIINIAPPKVIDGQRDEAKGMAVQPNGVDAQNYHAHIHVLYGESEVTQQQNWARRPISGRNGFLKNFIEDLVRSDNFATLRISDDFAQAPAEQLCVPPSHITSLQDLLDIANEQAEISHDELEARGETDVLMDLARNLKATIDKNNGEARLVILERPGAFFPLTIEAHLPQNGMDLGGRWFRAAGFAGVEGKEPPTTKEKIKPINEVVMLGGTNSYQALRPL